MGSIAKPIKLKKLQRPRAQDIIYCIYSDYQNKTVKAYLSGRNVFLSALTGARKNSTFELARIFRATVSFLVAQFRHKVKQALVNFRLKYSLVITLVQGKQICSFDRRRRNPHTFNYFGRSEWNLRHQL